jgi:Tol biopolymer transport system component
MQIILFYIALVVMPWVCFGAESSLRNIRQITFSEMGFEKAGEAYFSPDEKTIIFQAVPKGQTEYQIYSISLDGGSPTLVSTGKGACTCAYFHPGGKKIIFASSHSDPNPVTEKEPHVGYKWDLTPYMNIYEANPDGTNLRALTSGPAYHAECAYSPDGNSIVYASNESGSMNVYVMNSDGTNPRQLTFTSDAYNGGPFFSPDGRKVLFRADRQKRDYLQIYVLDIVTGQEQQLTDNDAVNWAPYWYPDGNTIAFTTSLHGHHRYEIYLLHLPSGAMYRVTDSPGFDGLPVFSRDGSNLLWTSKRGEDHTCQVFIADFISPFNEVHP